MNAKFFYSLSIVAVAFALVLGFGTLNAARAVPGENGYPVGTATLFGPDKAANSILVVDRDRDEYLRAHEFDTYGLMGTSQE